ncbi:catalase-domain-containing protein [Microthyrium microscopicum]|uniref:Catalase n=1 Tax=Microthyrium microscopicum TaxID=703497 RepID=A0A6A6USG9_9PEZI|nr:catalase-domain-containing protein [Microthyrium microscopicum]
MAGLRSFLVLFASLGALSAAQCPYGHTSARSESETLEKREAPPPTGEHFIDQFVVNDTNVYLTSDVGGPMEDQNSLVAGDRGPTLLEDFIFRQKITHFDHERVPERAVHARGAGAHGVFESYGDFSNITAASFLSKAGKKTPTFTRFSTVAGSRGSADTARDVHGFATRFYTDEGNFDLVGNNIPVFFIQDAILFPDLIHSVKPQQDREIPQAATAHDSAWDFFSQQPSCLHTLFWAMAGHGIVRSFRHMDGFGVHTYRFVTDDGKTKLVKFHWKTLIGKASVVWEEAQALAGKNADFHRQDLWEAIESGHGPEWEFGVQIMEEDDALKFGFDLMDPTKIVPEELVPVTKLGKMTLNRNPTNYFAETEQVMFQPGHIVRGVDFSEDPLLQGRIFSYLDTQLNRNGGPNFEQLPINRPVVPIHNNNRDGAGQMLVHANNAPYSPNTLNNGSPKQATQAEGRGFFTAPNRSVSGKLQRAVRSTFEKDYWSQPRLIFNSLVEQEQQFLINAIRFETSHIKSATVKTNVVKQLNKISNKIAKQVAEALGMTAPAPDSQFYHDKVTKGISTLGTPLLKLAGLNIGVLTSTKSIDAATVSTLKSAFKADGVNVKVVGESLANGIDLTYSAADATDFDAIVVAAGSSKLFDDPITQASSLYPAGRPNTIVLDAYRYGKPIAFVGNAKAAQQSIQIPSGPGVYSDLKGRFVSNSTYGGMNNRTREKRDAQAEDNSVDLATNLRQGLKTFRFLNRFPVEK